MKYFLFGAALFGIASFTAEAHPPTVVQEKCAGVRAVKQHVDELLTRYKPEEIAIISDNDGVLTNQSMPNIKTVAPRGDMVNVLKDWHDKGLFVIVSSAWDAFDETISKLRTLGLAETLGLLPEQKNDESSDDDSDNEIIGPPLSHTDTSIFHSESSRRQALDASAREAADLLRIQSEGSVNAIETEDMLTRLVMQGEYGNQVDYVIQGRVISARHNPSPEVFYRAKYFALDFAKRETNSPFKAVVFIDDSMGTHILFKKHMDRTKWYQNAETVRLLELPEIRGLSKPDDFLNPETMPPAPTPPAAFSFRSTTPSATMLTAPFLSASALTASSVSSPTISIPATNSTGGILPLSDSSSSAGTPPSQSYVPFSFTNEKRDNRDLARSRVLLGDSDEGPTPLPRTGTPSLSSSTSSTKSLGSSQEILAQ